MRMRRRVSLLLGLVALASARVAAAGDPVPAARAAEHVGEEVTVEGRVVATHSSQLATVIAFNANFAGFTAKILAGDRPKFPPDLEQRYRDKLVRVSGQVTEYRGKPEMTLRDPGQLALAPGETPVPPGTTTPRTSPTPTLEETISQTLSVIEARLGALEGRLGAIEQALAAQAAVGRGTTNALTVGTPAADVRDALGDPVNISRGPQNSSVWLYGAGRSVTFDRGGRVVSWTGF